MKRETIKECYPTHQIKLVLALLTVTVLGLGMVGCGRKPAPTPTPSTIPPMATPQPTATTPPTTIEATASPPTATTEPAATPMPEDTPSPTVPPPPPTPIPIPCGPPPGWVVYTVQPGDNLFRLALNTRTTVTQVQQANCLGNTTNIVSGQPLYLPFIPVRPTDTRPPPPPVEPTDTPEPQTPACTSDFCPNPDLDDTFSLDPGGPDDPTFSPCQIPRPSPWMDTIDDNVDLGQRRYFYVCDFPASPISAEVTRSDELTQQVTLLREIPNPDLQMGNAQAVIDWPALPFQPTGMYTLTVADGDGNQAQMPFWITLPTEEHILAVPAAGPPGTIFQIYYVFFNLHETPTFLFFGEDEPSVGGQHVLTHRSTWQISIDQPLDGASGKGWAQAPLVSTASDQRAAYSITYDSLRIANLFWLR